MKNYGSIVFMASFLFLPGQATAVSAKLKAECQSDYAAYCSMYKKPESATGRACMRAHRHQLLDGCIEALWHSGLATKADIDRYHRERGFR